MAGLDRGGNATPCVIFQQLLSNGIQCGLYGCDLGQHIHAITIFPDHLCDAAHLTFNSVQPFQKGFFVRLHDVVPIINRCRAMGFSRRHSRHR